jgi:hypothetical protein
MKVATLINRTWVVLWMWADEITRALKPCRAHRACLLPVGHSGSCIPAKPKAGTPPMTKGETP